MEYLAIELCDFTYNMVIVLNKLFIRQVYFAHNNWIQVKMSGSSCVHQMIQVQTGMHDESQATPLLNGESLTIDSLVLDAGLRVEQKKRKVEEIYANGTWKEVDIYEANKVWRIIRYHIFKQVKFCKGEGAKILTNSFEKKNAKILKYRKSHEKADLTKKVGYEYNIMKLSGYSEETTSLTDRALWWKSYNEEVIEEIRQQKGRVSSAIKLSVIQGMYTHGKMLV